MPGVTLQKPVMNRGTSITRMICIVPIKVEMYNVV